MSDSLRPHGLQHARLPCPSPTLRTCSNSCPSSRWCHPTISSSVVPTASSSHQEASTSLLSSSIRVQTEWKPQCQETNQNWPHGSQSCLTQWNYESCHVESLKMGKSWWRVLTKCGPLRREWPLQCSCLENPTNSMKRQKDRTVKDELPRSVGAPYATGDQWINNFRKLLKFLIFLIFCFKIWHKWVNRIVCDWMFVFTHQSLL